MSKRYFSTSEIHGDRVALEGDEARHLLHVMRAGVGDRIVLFDGRGWEFDAEVTSCRRKSVEFTVLAWREVSRELERRLVMGVALPKGERQKWLVEKLTELGVAELVPLHTERGVAQPGSAAVERLRRAVIEASKQCGRNRLMQISAPRPFEQFVSSADARESLCVVADPLGQPMGAVIGDAPRAIWCAVGPEGGFTDDELGIAVAAGWKPVSLGARILRVETAAIALAARLSDR